MTRQDEARQLLAKLDELAQDETLLEEDTTVLVAGLVGILSRMQQNPTWARVMAKADTRSIRVVLLDQVNAFGGKARS